MMDKNANPIDSSADSDMLQTPSTGLSSSIQPSAIGEVLTPPSGVTNEIVETARVFYLKFSDMCRPFNLPDYTNVAHVALNKFKDPAMILTTYLAGSEKIYRLKLSEPQPVDQSLRFKIMGENYDIPLHHEEPRRGNRYGGGGRSGLLLTFQGAADDPFTKVPNKEFDRIVACELKLLLEKPTENQKGRGTNILNGNRYCVIQRPTNLNIIPETIAVTDPDTKLLHNVKVTYAGQARYCGRCQQKHIGPCPELAAFYKAKEERERMSQEGQIPTKILSDSTLRNANAVGLTADVMCQSGAGIGQVVQAAMDDPDSGNKDLVIIAGANDIKCNQYNNEGEYSYNVEKGLMKLVELAKELPERDVFFIKTDPSYPQNYHTPEQSKKVQVRQEFLEHSVDNLIDECHDGEFPIENLKVTTVAYDVDDSGHPTIEATKSILEQLDNKLTLKKKLVWNDKYSVHDSWYRGVQPIYNYGCNHCAKFGKGITHKSSKTQLLCDICWNVMTGCERESELYERIRKEVDDRGETLRKRKMVDCHSDEERKKEERKKHIGNTGSGMSDGNGQKNGTT